MDLKRRVAQIMTRAEENPIIAGAVVICVVFIILAIAHA